MIKTFLLCGCLASRAALANRLNAQNLTLEGQTGGFITPTAYVVYSAKGQFFSHPAVGYHFVDASKVIGNMHTFSIAEGFANRAEVGYTRSVHHRRRATTATRSFSSLWHSPGMNIFSGKVVAIKDGQFGPWTPGLAVGGGAHQRPVCDGALDQELTGTLKSYTNGDVYVAVTKTWLHPPFPFLVNLGWKATNASIYGSAARARDLADGCSAGWAFRCRSRSIPSLCRRPGFTQEPPTSKNLGAIPLSLRVGRAHLPTTLDYAVRVTQKENPHFAFDIGVGQVAGNIGTTLIPTGNPAQPYAPLAVDLQARHVVGMGLSLRY